MANREEASESSKRGKTALKRLDEAKFSWYHVKILAVNGVGFFTVISHFKFLNNYLYFNIMKIIVFFLGRLRYICNVSIF